MVHEIEDFERDVIEQSRSQPVLADFWAEWCGPCRALGPILEKLEGEGAGRFRLAKIDVDRNQSVAARYGVQGIPAVKLFIDGEVVAEFTGALPESQVARWLDANLPSAERAELEEAIARVQSGRVEEGRALLADLLERQPENESARVLLAQLLVFEDPERAVEMATGLRPDGDHVQIASDVKGLAALLLTDEDALAEAPVRPDYLAGLAALRGQDFERALDRFIAVASRDKGYAEEGARKACVAIFNYLGREHPLTARYRRPFQSALN